MKISDVKVGAKFRDPKLKSSPPHYRIHVVRDVQVDKFTAEHVASGNTRTFGLNPEVVSELEAMPPAICVANLDDLVGERVRLELVDGGNLGGRVTAVTYHEIEFVAVGERTKFREVVALELDRTGASTYPLRDIRRIVVQG